MIIIFLIVALFTPKSVALVSFSSQRSFMETRASEASRLPSALSMAIFDDTESPRSLVSQGMEAFKNGDIQGSIAYFDKADAKVPDGRLTPFLWQRGLSYYYADRFEDASKQVGPLLAKSLARAF